ncbi:MOSC domain-containing protein [Candidimonas sp. SYP-B2681]|uniref:MOSC domain-containing protein n=1 Tax=Candidimonas sp. SYP-B2681 TaxID=2497686 RepID=UPI000F85BCDE|nr:MOSC N-terminal beta barrel domain-containing protein [Candidimonas sp. SYP-B2681]RTZ43362.1 MOSC domain-containing protein [Candidimonas sp. SYP-B2681]
MTITILSLHSYPVKSCAGLTHGEIGVSEAGLSQDRQWVIVNRQGVFLTQRQLPRMALIQPAVANDTLTLTAPGMGQISISATTDTVPTPPVSVRIWSSDTSGQDEGDEVAQWLTEFLGTPCRLLRVHPLAERIASPQHVNAWRRENQERAPDFPARHQFGFADGFPFLVANQGSLDELNRQLQTKGEAAVPMNRFRPNIVLQGLDAYEEDYIASLRIGKLVFGLVKRCARCPIPNIDQSTAVAAAEPGFTLAAKRRFPEGVLFGVNAVVSGASMGTYLRAGDPVDVDLSI